ncbi:MAG: cobalamin biosynthesis protein [Anaerolineae bacterium]|nr:cobalamin biosynthesis protein [Anaerolineae bacterium]
MKRRRTDDERRKTNDERFSFVLRPSSLVILATAFDWLIGDPPNALHPVAWFGKLVAAMERRAPRDNPRAELVYGAGMTACGIAIAALPALLIEHVLGTRGQPRGLPLLVLAVLLKMTFAWRGLMRAGQIVQRDLETRATENARDDLRALVSRDTRALDTSQLAAAAIESLAENANDSFVAPLFYYRLFGLPGAFVYRAVNTLDAMIGYHGRYEFLGKVAARVDDALNFIPARLTALLLVLAARFTRTDAHRAWQTMRRDHARTESPNAGYPMSAMAGALDVRLEKVGHYVLNENGRAPCPRDIARAARVVSVALLFAAAVFVVWMKDERRMTNDEGRMTEDERGRGDAVQV